MLRQGRILDLNRLGVRFYAVSVLLDCRVLGADF